MAESSLSFISFCFLENEDALMMKCCLCKNNLQDMWFKLAAVQEATDHDNHPEIDDHRCIKRSGQSSRSSVSSVTAPYSTQLLSADLIFKLAPGVTKDSSHVLLIKRIAPHLVSCRYKFHARVRRHTVDKLFLQERMNRTNCGPG